MNPLLSPSSLEHHYRSPRRKRPVLIGLAFLVIGLIIISALEKEDLKYHVKNYLPFSFPNEKSEGQSSPAVTEGDVLEHFTF